MITLRFTERDIPRGHLVLVNPSHPINRETPRSRLVPVNPESAGIFLEKQTGRMLSKVMALLNCYHEILPVSGYRSVHEQQEIYARCLREHGVDFTRRYVALPGCSEHHTGLAIDLAENNGSIDTIRPDFPDTGACARFRALSPQYGFIERYPAGSEQITQIAHEPWHFRYVGYPHSEIITREKITLEDYTEHLKLFCSQRKPLRYQSQAYHYDIFYLPVQDNQETVVEIPDGTPFQASGNNVDGVVVTLWKKQR